MLHQSVIHGAGLIGAEVQAQEKEKGAVPLPSKKATKYTVYGQSYCKFTRDACQLLQDNGIKPIFRPFSDYNDQARITIRSLTPDNHSTMPMVFLGGKFIGGYDELKQYLDSNK